jgi:hypothetical protein
MRKVLRAFLLTAAVVLPAIRLDAGLITYSDRATFNAQGTIAFNSNFDDFSSGFSYPGTPYTRGDVAYSSTENLVTGTGTGYAPIRNVMTNNWWSPVQGTIATGTTQYDLFGFDIGVLSRQDRISFSINTNLGSYNFPLLTIANGSSSMDFFGFATTGLGEYFTGFELTAEFGNGSLPGVTDVALGVQAEAAPTPEPASMALLAMGGGLLAFGRKRFGRRQTANLTA